MRCHGASQRWQSRGIANRLRHRCAVKIRAKPNAVFAKMFDQMIKMAKHDIKTRISLHTAIGAQKGNSKIQPNQSIAFGNGSKLAIGKVALMRADFISIGMRRHQRLLG